MCKTVKLDDVKQDKLSNQIKIIIKFVQYSFIGYLSMELVGVDGVQLFGLCLIFVVFGMFDNLWVTDLQAATVCPNTLECTGSSWSSSSVQEVQQRPVAAQHLSAQEQRARHSIPIESDR